jgi:UDP-N-acetyl-D-galactosamine dehydrogenase
MDLDIENIRIAVIGLGYVGLPLAVEFGKQRPVLGFDTNRLRVLELKNNIEGTGEVSIGELAMAKKLTFSDNPEDLTNRNFYIVCVPTPVDEFKRPDLRPLLNATRLVGSVLRRGDVVVYESTVYPGCTEEECLPLLEHLSGLTLNTDFYIGYSPERINPGDPYRKLKDIKKITSGSSPESASLIDRLYGQIITAGTFSASSIRIAEAAKVIENIQRDVNIGLMNELSIIFNMLKIDTSEVLKAAGTKWNFLPFRPGLVGGHCIGVDPYYLTHKAQALGYNPEVILAGRRINDSMANYVVTNLIKKMANAGINISVAKILILGLAFKENCPDLRNSKVADIFYGIKNYGCSVDVFDPLVQSKMSMSEYGIELIEKPKSRFYDAVILAVPHEIFLAQSLYNLRSYGKETSIFFDIKAVWEKNESDFRL